MSKVARVFSSSWFPELNCKLLFLLVAEADDVLINNLKLHGLLSVVKVKLGMPPFKA